MKDVSKIDALITSAKAPKRHARFTDAVIADLRKILEHNDSGEGKRITVSAARKHLLDAHGVSTGLTPFTIAIEEIFGRTWGGK